MSGLIKSSAKILAIAGLAIGFAAFGFAKGGTTSIISALNNNNANNNTTPSVTSQKKSSSSGGSHTTGGHTGSTTGGHQPPQCVPEPASMLVMGLGAGFVALRKKFKKA